MSTIALISMLNDTAAAAPMADAGSDAEALFAEHGTALYRFCRFALGRDDEAEDVVQETFLKLLVHLGRRGDRSNLRAWLFAVAANGCRDRIRSRRRWIPWREQSHDPAVLPDERAPDRAAAAGAFRALPPRDRLLLALRVQGLSYREISSASGVREQSVGKLLARAIDRWKAACAPAASGREPGRPVPPRGRS